MASLRSRKPMKFGLQHRHNLLLNSVLKADLAYGDYPYVEKIPEKRLAIFPPMELINQDGEMQTLVQKGETTNINQKNR